MILNALPKENKYNIKIINKEMKWLINSSRHFQSHHPYYPYDPYPYRQGLICVLRITVTIVLSGKDGKHRKHGIVQIFWIH